MVQIFETAFFSAKEYYSCQMCGKTFEKSGEIEVIQGNFPLCSQKCKFKLIYRILNEYPNQILKKIFMSFFPERILPKTRYEGLFEITKEFSKREREVKLKWSK